MSWPTYGQVWLKLLQPNSLAQKHPGSYSIVLICLQATCFSVAHLSNGIASRGVYLYKKIHLHVSLAWMKKWGHFYQFKQSFGHGIVAHWKREHRQMQWNLITLNSCHLFRQSSIREISFQVGNSAFVFQWSDCWVIYLCMLCTCLFWFREFPFTSWARCCVPKTLKSYGLPRGEELIVRCAASNSINKGL